MIRTIFYYTINALLFAISLFPLLIIYILSLFSKNLAESLCNNYSQLWSKLIVLSSGSKVKVINLANTIPDKALYISNHQSYLDIPAIIGFVNKKTVFISKKEAMNIPILNFWLKKRHTILIDRSSIKDGIKGINKAAEIINQGLPVAIFPEGTRSIDGNIQNFHKGSFRVSVTQNIPILPITLINLNKIWPKKKYKINKAEVTIVIHPIIEVSSLNEEQKKNIDTYVRDIILEGYKKYKCDKE